MATLTSETVQTPLSPPKGYFGSLLEALLERYQSTAYQLRLYLNSSKNRRDLLTIFMIVVGFVVTMGGTFAIGKMNMGIWVLGGLIAAIVAISIIFKPEAGLYVLIFFVFANLSDVLEVTFKIPDTNKALVALILVGTLGSRIILQHRPFIFRTTEILILSYGVIVVISLLLSDYEIDELKISTDWFKDFAIMLIIVQLASKEKVFKKSVWILLLTGAFLSLMSTYQNLTGDYANDFYGLAKAPVHEIISGVDGVRVTGPLDDPNFYALILLVAYPAALYRYFAADRLRVKLLAAVCAGLIATTIILTYSRGAFIAIILVSALIIKERKMNIYKIGAIVTFLLVVLMPVMPAGFTDRLSTLSVFANDDKQAATERSFQGRTSEALVALQMFRDNPLFGVGAGNYPHHYQEYSRRLGIDDRTTERDAHSLYLETLAELGLVGLIIFVLILVVVFRELNRASRLAKQMDRHDLVSWIEGVRYGLLGYLLGSFFLHGVTIRYMWLIIGFALASGVMISELNQDRRRRSVQFESELNVLEPSFSSR
jgi:O-antigen ligase